MKGAQPEKVDTAFLQLHITSDHIRDIYAGKEILDKGIWDQRSDRTWWTPEGVPALVHARGQLLAADALVMTLHGSRLLALAFSGGLFVELARAQFGQQAGFFDGAFEAAQSSFEGLVFFETNDRHGALSSMVERPGGDPVRSKVKVNRITNSLTTGDHYGLNSRSNHATAAIYQLILRN